MALIIRNAWVITFDPSNPVIENGVIRIEEDRIVSLGPAGANGPVEPADPSAEIIDAGNRIVMPGLVCAHHHLYSAPALGLALPGPPPENFPTLLKRLWWPMDRALTEEDIAASTDVGLLDCLAHGVTTLIDHHESQGVQRGVLARIADRVRLAGLRACLCLGASDRFGKGREGLEESRAFLTFLPAEDVHVRGMVGLHASFTVEDGTLGAAADLARETGVGIHVHLSEDPVDNEKSVERFGARPLERFAREGMLGRKTLLVHGVHLEPAELETLASTGAALVHNPESNMNNGVGIAPVPEAIERGITVGLGTDGMSSDLLSQARVSLLLRRHATRDPRTGFSDAWRMLSVGNPEIASRCFGIPLGKITPGGPADLVVLDALPPTPLNADNVAGHVLFGLAGARARDVVCAGRVLWKGCQPVTLDAEEVASRARRLAAELWKRLQA